MPTKKSGKWKSWTRSMRNSWESFKIWLTRMYKIHSKNIKTPQIKNLRRYRNNLLNSEDFNKLQSQPKETTKKEKYEIKKTTQDMKEELNKHMGKLRKKNQTEILEIKIPFSQIKNTVEVHYSRLEQVEDRISELKYKIDIKEKKHKNS
jgi:hypothetical protein